MPTKRVPLRFSVFALAIVVLACRILARAIQADLSS